MAVQIDNEILYEHDKKHKYPTVVERWIDLKGDVTYRCRYCHEELTGIREVEGESADL